MGKIRAVIFDLDNTLYAYPPCQQAGQRAVECYLARTLGISQRQVLRAWLGARHIIHQRLAKQAASHSRLLYAQEALETLTQCTPVALTLQTEKVFWNAYLQKMKLRPGVLALLRFLHQRGIKVGIVSDLTTQIQLRKLIRLRLDRSIDYMVTSEQVGVEKPHLASLRLALQKLAVMPSAALFVGDSLDRDQTVARRCGVRFFQLQSDAEVERLAQLCTRA